MLFIVGQLKVRYNVLSHSLYNSFVMSYFTCCSSIKLHKRALGYIYMIGKAMRQAHIAHNVLKRCILNLLTAQKMHPSHVMAVGYFMMSTFTQLPNQVRRRKCMCFEVFF